MTSSQSKAESAIKILIVSLFFLFAFSSFIKPITDPDTSWHLKTGEYIYENRVIPQEDPFSYAEDKIPFIGKFILTQYWLAQVLFHLIYTYSGTLGLVLLGAATFTGTIALLWRVLKDRGFYMAMLISGFAVILLQNFVAIRPQMFTSLFTALMIFLLERHRDTGSRKYILWIPPIMLVWANMHGGYIYGVVVMLIYLFIEYIAFFFKDKSFTSPLGPFSKEQMQFFSIICIASIALSLINPNTYKAFMYAFTTHSQNLFSQIQEYQSPFIILKTPPSEMLIRYWAFVLITVILLIIFIIQRNIRPVLLIIFSISLSLMSIRYIPLFEIVATAMFKYIPFKPKKRMSPGANYAVMVITLIILSALLFYSHPFKGRSHYQYADSTAYAVTASDFLLDNKIKGNIFASYNKSSFLLFKLFPRSRVYSDSRFISVERYNKSLKFAGEFDSITSRLNEISNLIPKGIGTITLKDEGQDYDSAAEHARWRKMLEEMKVEIIVHEALNFFTGDISPIIFKLIQEDSWKLIHTDGNVMIFIKNTDKYKEIISKFNKPKSMVYDEIIEEGLKGLEMNIYGYYTSISLALLLKGIATDDTLYYIEKALSMAPRDTMTNYCKALHMLMTQKQQSE